MRAGLLRDMVVIEKPVETQNSVGETVISWEPYRRTYAAIRALGFYQAVRAEQMAADISHTVTIRWLPSVNGNMRIRWESRENRILYISSIVEVGNREWLEISVEERAGHD